MRLFAFVLAGSMLGPAAARAVEIPILGCHQAILSGDMGILARDIDCTGAGIGRWGVWLTDGASLNLNGHSLTSGFGGVYCQGRCTITGPGEIANAETACVSISDRTTIRDIDVHGCEYGIIGYDNYNDHRARLHMRNVMVHDNVEGGIEAETVKAKNVAVDGNEYGIFANGVSGKEVSVSGNAGLGIRSTRVSLRGLTALDNGDAGVDAYGRLALRSSTVLGNNGLGIGLDIISRTGPPKVRDTTCGASGLGDGSRWEGICTTDPP